MQELLTTSEAAARLGVNERHVRSLIEDNKIKARRVGRAWLVIAKSLEGWEKHPTKGRPKSTQE